MTAFHVGKIQPKGPLAWRVGPHKTLRATAIEPITTGTGFDTELSLSPRPSSSVRSPQSRRLANFFTSSSIELSTLWSIASSAARS